MKRTQSSAIICQGCRQGIRAHHGPGEGFFESVPGPNGIPIKHGWHVKKCWPRERTRRKKLRRDERRATKKMHPADIELETARRINKEIEAHMPETNDMSVPPPIPAEEPAPVQSELPAEIGMGNQEKRGLGAQIFKILDAIPTGQQWTAAEIVERLKAHGMSTTRATIGTLIHTYNRTRRPVDEVGRVGGAKGGNLKVYKFTADAPAEPSRTVSAPASMRHAKAQADKPPLQRPAAKPAPTPGLTHADLIRAFNDFQAFMVEALMDLRNQLSRSLK